MPSFLGPLGALVPIDVVSQLRQSAPRRLTYGTTIGGVRHVQVGARVHRSWDVSAPPGSVAEDLAALSAFVAGEFGDGPFWWVDAWSQVTNLLPPGPAVLERTWANTVYGGPQVLPDGSVVGRSLVATGSTAVVDADGAVLRLPCVPGRAVTASAWVSSTVQRVRVVARNAAGAVVASADGRTQIDGWERAHATLPPPAGAHHVVLEFTGAGRIARPALTWSPRMLGYHGGQGADSVVIEGLDQTPTIAHPGPGGQMAAATFTLVEVG